MRKPTQRRNASPLVAFATVLAAFAVGAVIAASPAKADDSAAAEARRYVLWGTNAELRGEARHDYDHQPSSWYANDHSNIFGPPRRRRLAINLHSRGGDATRLIRLQPNGEVIGEDHATQPNSFFFSRLGVELRAWRTGAKSTIFYDGDGEAIRQTERFVDRRAHHTPHRDDPLDIGSNPGSAGLFEQLAALAAAALRLEDAPPPARVRKSEPLRLARAPLDFGPHAGGVGAD